MKGLKYYIDTRISSIWYLKPISPTISSNYLTTYGPDHALIYHIAPNVPAIPSSNRPTHPTTTRTPITPHITRTNLLTHNTDISQHLLLDTLSAALHESSAPKKLLHTTHKYQLYSSVLREIKDGIHEYDATMP